MGTKWEQSGNKNPKVGQEWQQSGNKVGTRTTRMGTKWEQSGNKNPKVGQEGEQSGNKVGKLDGEGTFCLKVSSWMERGLSFEDLKLDGEGTFV